MSDHESSIYGELFELMAKEPMYWQIVARELIFGANVLYGRYKQARPHEVIGQPPPIDLNRIHASGRPVLVLYGIKPSPEFNDDISDLEFEQVHRTIGALEDAISTLRDCVVMNLPKTDLRLLDL